MVCTSDTHPPHQIRFAPTSPNPIRTHLVAVRLRLCARCRRTCPPRACSMHRQPRAHQSNQNWFSINRSRREPLGVGGRGAGGARAPVPQTATAKHRCRPEGPQRRAPRRQGPPRLAWPSTRQLVSCVGWAGGCECTRGGWEALSRARPTHLQMVACQSAMWISPLCVRPRRAAGSSPPFTKAGTRVPPSQLLPFPPLSGWLEPPTDTGLPLSVVHTSSVFSLPCNSQSARGHQASHRKR
jgi:hypothetical protein